ncbi:MAG: ferredoxin [Oscillibacter sp.]|nr:ferredoxin [Oscillibacter sp.]
MRIQTVTAVYFSPTGSTERTVRTVAQSLADALGVPMAELDLTRPESRAKEYSFTETDFVVVGTPTYAGKVPNKLLPDLQRCLRGGGALAAAVVTFGNRSFDNSLAELAAVLGQDGFCPLAGGAFAARHAFTDKLAEGRPDWEDRKQMEAFGRSIADKVKTLTDIPAPIQVPGDPDAPYYTPLGTDGQPAKFLKAKPKTDLSRCCGCGVCTRRCPMGSIDPQDVASVPGICIKCQSCVRHCTRHAKYFDDPAFLSHVAMLESHYASPKENQVFL